MQLDFVKLIWNMSLVCPWDCDFCCTNAVQVKQNGNSIIIVESGVNHEIRIENIDLQQEEFRRIADEGVRPNIFDMALQQRQIRGLELSFKQKISVLDNILPTKAQIDFAGGDPLVCYENYLVIKEASKKFGKDKIFVTSTGASLSRYNLEEFASVVGTFDFTFDEPINITPTNRPLGYNNANIKVAKRLAALNLKTRAQIPLHYGNLGVSKINDIYTALHDAGITELLLMRIFPVGRGLHWSEFHPTLTREDYLAAIEQYQKLESRLKYPKVVLQCALKNILNNKSAQNPCDLMQNSFGISPQGNLLISAWATSFENSPYHDIFVIGNLSKSTLGSLLDTWKVHEYKLKLNTNWGHCKIFAFVASASKNANALFEPQDPLYVSK